ncbi:MAG: tetratricopeptide repeat protein, partial [Candidatus Hodarchaeota archaeon]
FQQSLSLFEQIGNKQDIGRVFNNIGEVYRQKGELNQALDYYQRCLVIHEEIGNKHDVALALNNIGEIYRSKGDVNLALQNFQRGLPIFKEIDNTLHASLSLNNIGGIYRQKGELDKALDCHQQALALRKELGNKQHIAESLNSIGNIYQAKGDLNQALEYHKQSLTLAEEIGNTIDISLSLFYLISVASDKLSPELAQQYLQDLQVIEEKDQNKNIRQRYKLARGIFLKMGDKLEEELGFVVLHRVLTKLVTAKRLFRQIIAEEVVDHELTVEAIFNLCELLIMELKTLGNEEILDEVNQLAQKLLYIGQNQRSYSLLTKTYLLMAKLALLQPNIEEARRLLAQAQDIAKNKGYNRLLAVITKEQKRLEGKIPDQLLDEDISLLNRLGIIQLEGLVIALRQNRVEYLSEGYQPESPSLEDLKSFSKMLDNRRIKW